MTALTFKGMQDEVIFQRFDDLKFRPKAKRHLNEAVDELSRRIGFVKRAEVAAYDSTGLVAFVQPMHEINEVWEAAGPVSTSMDAAINQTNGNRLSPLPSDSPIGLRAAGGSPIFYQATSAVASDDSPSSALRIFPHGTTGFVAVVGRGRPPVMANDGDFSGLGAEYDDALIVFGRSRCARDDRAYDEAGALLAEFERAVKNASLARHPANDGPDLVPGMWAGEEQVGLGGW